MRLLDAHPEWRPELRRLVLSDDFLQVPAHLATVTSRLDAFDAQMEQLVARMGELAVRMDQLTSRLDQLAVRTHELAAGRDQFAAAQIATEERIQRLELVVERLGAAILALTGVTKGIDTRLGTVEGKLFEEQYRERGPAYFSRLARRLRVIDSGRLADLLDDAVSGGALSDPERDAVLLADVVLSGLRRSDDVEVYLLAEISQSIGDYDVERAAERAEILAKLGRPVIPIAAGNQIHGAVAQLARDRGVWQVLDGQVTAPRGA